MPVNINEFKVYCENIIANKTQSGNTITPSQFNVAANRAQMDVFEADRLVFLKTGELTDYLTWFSKNIIKSPNQLTGYLDYPEDFQHTIGVRAYSSSKERTVERVANSAWGTVQQSELQKPTFIFPKFSEFKGHYRFLPKNIGIVIIDYLRTPLKPNWAYTVVNNVAVYDSVNSVDFEFPEFAFKRVADSYISIIAQNIKDPQLEAYVQQQKASDKTIL